MSRAYLVLLPFLVVPLAGIRALRVPGLSGALGVALFAAAVAAAGRLGGKPSRAAGWAGALLGAPFALLALLWVGLGPPWQAAPVENRMRYLVLLAASAAVTAGFVALKEALAEVGERALPAVGAAAALLAGSAYLVWTGYEVGVYALSVRTGEVPAAVRELSDVADILLFAGCALTYLATAAFAAAMGRAGWLGRGAARAAVAVPLLALAFLLARGLAFPDPAADATPWFLRPGFVAGIPAIPWVVPHLLGVGALRRAGGGAP